MIKIWLLFLLCSGAVWANETDSEPDETPEVKVTPTFSLPAKKGEIAVTQKVVYPKVISFQGNVEIFGKDNHPQKIVKGLELKEKALIKTSAFSRLEIELGSTQSFIVLDQSEVNIPSISWDSGDAPLVILKKGTLFWKGVPKNKISPTADQRVALTSELFQFLAPETEFILSYSPQVPSAEVQVISGRMFFSAMNAEEGVELLAGEKASFKGVLENKEVAYDVLLKGRKIPRGQLGAKESFSVSEALTHLEPPQPQIDPKILKAKQAAALKKKLSEIRDDKFICIKPRGQFNQCLWQWSEGSCWRRRCDANGEWSDKKEIKGSAVARCRKAQDIIGLCDY